MKGRRCRCPAQVGVDLCAWIAMVVNVFWVCFWFIGLGSYSTLLLFHAIVGFVIGADLKIACHSENAKRYGTFLVANGIFIAFESILLIWAIVDLVVTPSWARRAWRYDRGLPLLFGSVESIVYILVEIILNLTFELIVRSAWKRGKRPSRPLPSVSVVAWSSESGK